MSQGLEECLARHQECANQLYDGLKKMGLEPFVEDKVNFLFNPFIPVTTRFFQIIWYDLSDQRLVRKYFKCCLELIPQLSLQYIFVNSGFIPKLFSEVC